MKLVSLETSFEWLEISDYLALNGKKIKKLLLTDEKSRISIIFFSFTFFILFKITILNLKKKKIKWQLI
jgi:hypothetical protein